MGIVGLIFGAVAVGLGLVPVFGIFVSAPFAIVGMILCAITLSKARIENLPFGPALAGLIISFAALI